jgi:hypothetical protein
MRARGPALSPGRQPPPLLVCILDMVCVLTDNNGQQRRPRPSGGPADIPIRAPTTSSRRPSSPWARAFPLPDSADTLRRNRPHRTRSAHGSERRPARVRDAGAAGPDPSSRGCSGRGPSPHRSRPCGRLTMPALVSLRRGGQGRRSRAHRAPATSGCAGSCRRRCPCSRSRL